MKMHTAVSTTTFLILLLLQTNVNAFSFQTERRLLCQRKTNRNELKASLDVLEILRPPVESYVNLWVPLFKVAPLPEALLHWGHGSAMAIVLLAMGGTGSFLGWQIRLGNGDKKYPFTLGNTARKEHPKVMGLATLFFLLGGQGGLVLQAAQGHDILKSDHALTALSGLSLLLLQVSNRCHFVHQLIC